MDFFDAKNPLYDTKMLLKVVFDKTVFLKFKISNNFKVPSGQIRSASEWYHWKGLEEDINCYRFLIFDFEYLKRLQSSAASNPPTCWDHGLYGNVPQYFPPNCAPKMREIQQLFLGLWLVCKEFHRSAI
jgi:hypothetical protein